MEIKILRKRTLPQQRKENAVLKKEKKMLPRYLKG
jgi:hypothetical protein